MYYMLHKGVAFRALQLWELFTTCPKFLPYSASALEALLLLLPKIGVSVVSWDTAPYTEDKLTPVKKQGLALCD